MTDGTDLLQLGIEPVKTRKAATLGEAGYERKERDFYPTEPWVTRALCQAVDLRGDPRKIGYGHVWEPACGNGRMAKVLDEAGYWVIATDITDYGYGSSGIDFLECQPKRTAPSWFGAIVTNPPFNLAVQFILRALALTKETGGTVAILQRHEFDAPRSNHPLFQPPFAAKLILHKRPRWSDDGKAGPRFPYAWYLWDWRHQGPPILRYLPDPGQPLPSEGRLL
jgi:hypothetical protein